MNNFIEKYKIKDPLICENLISYFNENTNFEKHPGLVYHNDSIQVKKDQKDSIDMSISFEKVKNLNIFRNYFFHLFEFCSEYRKKYTYCDRTSKWSIFNEMNIQYYPLGGGYKSFHMERFCKEYPFSSRHLVFMTYLNTVKSGGETEFYYQKVKEKPVIGKTLIWPADWTHTHRGIPSLKEEKYIITGWFNFIE